MARRNALVELGVPQAALDRELRESAAVKAEKKREAMKMAGWAKSISPVDHADYAKEWKVEQGKGIDGETRVVNNDFKAHWIEDGTGGDTPTPEFAVAARTAIEFGGTAADVINRP